MSSIKTQNLYEVTKELVDEALTIDRKNKEKIFKFIFNLVNNGGNKTQAAFDAGYGAPKDKNGNPQTDEQRKDIAATEAHRLLRNDKINAVYENLAKDKLTSTIFSSYLKKSHLVARLYQMFDMFWKTEPKVAIAALDKISQMSGYYIEEKDDDSKKFNEMVLELTEACKFISGSQWNPRATNDSDGERKNRVN